MAFGMFGGLMKRDPQQMARVPLIIITIVRNHRAALFVLIVFCTPCYGRQPLPVRFWLRFVRRFFLFVVCTPCYKLPLRRATLIQLLLGLSRHRKESSNV